MGSMDYCKVRSMELSLIHISASTLGATAQVSKTYYVSKPGTLISMMTEEEANSITHLTLTGKLNAEDFRHLRCVYETVLIQIEHIADKHISFINFRIK